MTLSFVKRYWFLSLSVFTLAAAITPTTIARSSESEAWVVFESKQENRMVPAARTRLRSDDEVQSPENGRAQLLIGSAALLVLEKDSQLSVNELTTADPARADFTLNHGFFWIRVDQAAALSFSLPRPKVVFEAKGPVVASVLLRDKEPVILDVQSGEMTVRAPDGSSQTVTSGQRARWEPANDKVLRDTTPADTEQALAAWASRGSVAQARDAALQVREHVPFQDVHRARGATAHAERDAAEGDEPPADDTERPRGESFPKNEVDIRQ